MTSHDYINMPEDQFEQLTHDEIYESYTEHVNILGDYVMNMNKIDARRNKLIKILKQRSGEELDKQNISDSSSDSEPEYDDVNIIESKQEKLKKVKNY
jgi:hypothetical protein